MHMEMGSCIQARRGAATIFWGLIATTLAGCSSSHALYPLGFSDAAAVKQIAGADAAIRLVIDEPYRTFTSRQRGHWSASGQWYVIGPPLARLTADLYRRGFVETTIAWSAGDRSTPRAGSPAYTVHPRVREFRNDIDMFKPSQTLAVTLEAEIRAPDGTPVGTVTGSGSDSRILTSAFVWDYEIAVALRRAIEPALVELVHKTQQQLDASVTPLPAFRPAQSTASAGELSPDTDSPTNAPTAQSENLKLLADEGGTTFLAGYNRLLVENFTTADELAPNTNAAALHLTLSNLADYIANEAWACELFPSIDRWGVAGPDTLVVSGSIYGLVEGNSLERALIGFGLGRAQFDTTILLRDGTTGEVLKRFVINKKSFWYGGIAASAQSTSSFIKAAADHVVSFLAAGGAPAAG
jgi:hypothetical protein